MYIDLNTYIFIYLYVCIYTCTYIYELLLIIGKMAYQVWVGHMIRGF